MLGFKSLVNWFSTEYCDLRDSIKERCDIISISTLWLNGGTYIPANAIPYSLSVETLRSIWAALETLSKARAVFKNTEQTYRLWFDRETYYLTSDCYEELQRITDYALDSDTDYLVQSTTYIKRHYALPDVEYLNEYIAAKSGKSTKWSCRLLTPMELSYIEQRATLHVSSLTISDLSFLQLDAVEQQKHYDHLVSLIELYNQAKVGWNAVPVPSDLVMVSQCFYVVTQYPTATLKKNVVVPVVRLSNFLNSKPEITTINVNDIQLRDAQIRELSQSRMCELFDTAGNLRRYYEELSKCQNLTT